MITKAIIVAQPDTLDEIDVANLVAVIKTGERYKLNPLFFSKLQEDIEDVDGSIQAKIINAVIRAMEKLGIGAVEINQAQTVGTDGVVYNKNLEREGLINYILNVLYQGIFETKAIDPTIQLDIFLSGNYLVGRLPLDYQGYL